MKKSLSILLALLMILSSMPIMAFTASAEQADPNVMADYTYEDWYSRSWGTPKEGTESCKGGNSVLIENMYGHFAFTFVNLETNTDYMLDFDWKSIANADLQGTYPWRIYVFPKSAYGSKEDLTSAGRGANDATAGPGTGLWHSGNATTPGGFYPKGATTTLEAAYPDCLIDNDANGDRNRATAGLWQHFSDKFTTNDTDTEYAIMINITYNSTGNPGEQDTLLSDFRLITAEDSEKIAIEDKLAGDWYIPANAKIYDDSSFTQDGITSTYKWTFPTWQKISTTVTLDPNTDYAFSFDYFAEENATANPYVQYIEIFSAEAGSVLNAENWANEAYSKTKNGLVDSRKVGADCGNETKAGTWQHVRVPFTTDSTGKSNIIIYGTAAAHVPSDPHSQKIYLANVKIDSIVAKKPGNLLNNACYANGDVSWSKNINSGDSGDMEARMSFATGLDNPAFSINGGYAWAFGYGYGALAGDVYGYVYVKANGLKAGATYDFSYIYSGNSFIFALDSVTNANGDRESYIVEPTTTGIVEVPGAYKVATLFTVPADGDYTIALKTNRDMKNPTWGDAVLSDLELYERGTMYNVGVSKEGYGNASADKTGLTEEGTAVTFTAKADLFERFLGWYNGDELVSEDLVYTTTVAGELNLVAKFTTNSENLMADYTVAGGKFVSRYWGSPSDSAVSRYGGNAVYLYDAPHQTFVTKATLEAGKEYTFSFEWKSENNQYNNLFPQRIEVKKVNTPEIDILGAKENAWVDGAGYKGELGEDIETGVNGSYANQDMANSCEWNNITVKFTATEAGEYGIIIPLTFEMQDLGEGSKHYNNKQSIYFSDFVLKTEPVIEYTGTKYDWRGVRWSSVTDSADSKDGGYAYNVNNAMNQNINTTLTLKPGTTYNYSFNWKAVANDKGLAYVQSSSIYSANSGNPELPATSESDPNWGTACNYKYESWGDYTPIYIPNEGYSNLMTDVSNPNGVDTAEDDVLKGWNTYSATFTTTEDEEYYLFINFGLKGAIGNQTVIISDVIIEEVTVGTAPTGDAFDAVVVHGGTSLRKENEAASSGASSAQAIRYKFTVANDLIANAQTDGYWLEEYGAIVARADQLEGHAYDPIFGATAYSIKQGVAYNKTAGTNIVFDENENGDITFTAALYNIPGEQYGTQLAVRPYAKFMNSNGDTYIRYGATWYACVFDVAKAILDDANADADDVTYVNNTLLAGDIKAAYDAWVAAQ